jgi:Inner membrane component of T3SS, cytoplasmic domain
MRIEPALTSALTSSMSAATTDRTTTWVVEVLDRRQRVVQRVPITSWPASVGRRPGNAVTLDDAYVAGDHAELRLGANDDHLVLVDLGSKNGLRQPSDKPKVRRRTMALQHGDTVECGQTRLRLVDSSQPLAPERELEHRVHTSMGWAALLVAAVLGVYGFQAWFTAFDDVKPLAIATPVITTLGYIAAWAGLWGLANRVFHGAPNFLQHVAWVCLWLLGLHAFEWVVSVVSYSLDWTWLAHWERLFYYAFIALLLWGHVWLMSGRLNRATVGVVSAACMAMIGLSMTETHQAYGRLAPASLMTSLWPNSWRVAGGVNSAAFFDSVAADKATLDAMRKQESSGEDDE